MKTLTLLSVLLAASACKRPIKADAQPKPDYDKVRANAERSHGSLDEEKADR